MKNQLGLILVTSVVATAAVAQDLNIVDVRRHITLADDDVVYKDFYINGGEGDGLKKNMVVTAVRKIQVRDSSGAQSYGELVVPVGQLRIIAIYGKVAVAREYKLLSRDELPMLEQTGLMSGDRIDLKGAFVDDKKPVYKKKPVAAITTQKDAAVIAVVTTSAASTPTSEVTAPAANSSTPSTTAVTASSGPAPASVAPTVAEALPPAKTADAAPAKAE